MASRFASDAKFKGRRIHFKQDPETTTVDLPKGAKNMDVLETLLENGWSESFDPMGNCTKCGDLLSNYACSAWKRGEKEGYCAQCALRETPKMDSK